MAERRGRVLPRYGLYSSYRTLFLSEEGRTTEGKRFYRQGAKPNGHTRSKGQRGVTESRGEEF